MKIQNKCIFVSGGASGLGGACVRLLAEAGAKVVIADLNSETGNALAQDLGGAALFARTNVTEEADVQRAIQAAVEKFGALHGAINCAGIGHAEKLLLQYPQTDRKKDEVNASSPPTAQQSSEDQGKPNMSSDFAPRRRGTHSLEAFRRVIDVNLIGTFNVVRLAAAAMIENTPEPSGERGVIITTASVAAFEGQIGQVAYSASKGGIVGMVLPLARELARYGIRVLGIAPGIFDTPLLAGLPEPARVSLGQQVPFPPRLGRPEEYAALAKHMIENEMLNGTVLRLDGGIRMAPK